jgi:hypothetical protein
MKNNKERIERRRWIFTDDAGHVLYDSEEEEKRGLEMELAQEEIEAEKRIPDIWGWKVIEAMRNRHNEEGECETCGKYAELPYILHLTKAHTGERALINICKKCASKMEERIKYLTWE